MGTLCCVDRRLQQQQLKRILACEQQLQRLHVHLCARFEQQFKRICILHARIQQQLKRIYLLLRSRIQQQLKQQWLLLACKQLEQRRLGQLCFEQLLQRLALGSEKRHPGIAPDRLVRIRGDRPSW
jgi:hypothetical protein